MLSYKIKNNLLKFFSFLVITGILYIGYVLIKSSSNHSEKKEISEAVTKDKNFDLNYKIMLNDSVFKGLNKDLNSYMVEAKQATKDSENKYKLNEINVRYELNKEQSLTLFAKKGFLNEESNILDLRNNVEFVLGDIKFNTDEATIDLTRKDITGNSPTTLFYNNSYVTSDNFNTQNDNNLIIFNGNVSTIIDLSDY